MAYTVTKPGAGSLVTWHDAKNDSVIVPIGSDIAAGRICGYWEFDYGSGPVRVYKAFGNAAPGSDFTFMGLGSEYTDVLTGKLYVKTAADTWADTTD